MTAPRPWWLRTVSGFLSAWFPVGIQRHHGDEWRSCAEDLLFDASIRGPLATGQALAAMVFDTLWRAPAAHARAWRNAVVGTPPVLATLGPMQAAVALSGHWVARPVRGTWTWLRRMVRYMMVGALVGVVWVLWSAGQAAAHAPMLIAVGDDLVTQNLMAVVCLCVILLLSIPGVRAFRRWRAQGCPVLGPLIATGLGVVLGLYAMLFHALQDLPSDALEVFSTYPKMVETPVKEPYSTNLTEWSSSQKDWFVVIGEPGAERITLRPEMKKPWCQARLATLDFFEAQIKASTTLSPTISALLWKAHIARAAEVGCLSWDGLLRRDHAMLAWSWKHPGTFQETWERFRWLPIVNQLMSAHYIVLPRVAPQADKYCYSMISAKTGELSKENVQFCQSLHARWVARTGQPHPPRTWIDRMVEPFGYYMGSERERARLAPTLSETDLKWIQAEVNSRIHATSTK